MDRRQLLRVSALLTAGLALSACTGQEQPAEDPSASASPSRTFRFAQAARVLSLDPARTSRIESLRMSAQLMEPLVEADSNTGEPVAGVAASWEVSDDALTYTFSLVEGVTFSDGSALDAAAVLANVERWRLLASRPMTRLVQPYYQLFGEQASGRRPLVTSWEEVGPLQVRLTLSRPSASFLKALTQPSYRLVAPSVIGEDGYLTKDPVGSGPFVLESWDGSMARLAARKDHRSPASGVDYLEFLTIPHPEKRYYHLIEGNIDAYDQVALKDYVPLALDGYPVQSRDPYAISYLAFNLSHPAFKDARARQALAHAVDRGKLVGDFYPQGTSTANDFVPALFQVKNEESADAYRFDVEKAKTLLRSSLYANQEIPFYYPVGVSTPALPSPEGIYALLSANLVKAGFNIVPRPYQFSDEGSEDILANHPDAGLELTGFVGDFRDPTAFLGRVLAPASSAPEHLTTTPQPTPEASGEPAPSPSPNDPVKVGVSYQSLTQAIERADAQDSVDARRQSYREINAQMAHYLCALPLAYPVSGVTHGGKVGGYIVNATCLDDFSTVRVSP